MVGQAVTADCKALPLMHIAVDGNSALLPLRNGVNSKLRPGKGITAYKNIFLRGLIGKPVCLNASFLADFEFTEIQSAQINLLAD